jgi:hypothetical protein
MRYERDKSDGFPRGMLSVRSNSSSGSSALPPDHRYWGFYSQASLRTL